MKSPSLTSFLLGKQYIGIEHFSSGNEEKTAILLIEKRKEGLIILKKEKKPYEDTLHEKWDRRLPFFIIVNTNQVIQKEVLGMVEASDEKLLHKAFPNINWEEFYFEILRLNTKSIIAISRKIHIEEVLDRYQKQGVSITGISLGICVISEVINYFEGNKLLTNHQIVSWEEQVSIIAPSVDLQNTTYEINGLAIENSYVLAFSGILRLLLRTTVNTGKIIGYSQQLYENYNQKSFFSKGLKIMIGVLLTILLINFLVFTHYFKLDKEISESLLLSKSSLEEVSKVKKRIQSKEQKIKNVVAMTSSQSTLRINEITNKIPPAILLTELDYHPLENKINTEESIKTQEKVITLSGTTIDNVAFTRWVETIGRLKWVDNVIITRFGKYDLDEKEFSVKLTLK